VEPIIIPHSSGSLLALPTNIRLWWQEMAVTNALAYSIKATITDVKSFIILAPLAGTIKLITVIIYGFS
jgi:hypothetical protein